MKAWKEKFTVLRLRRVNVGVDVECALIAHSINEAKKYVEENTTDSRQYIIIPSIILL